MASEPMHLVILAHSPSRNTEKLLASASVGLKAGSPKAVIDTFKVLECSTDLLCEKIQQADGVLLFTTENFGYMSGGMKDFFDRCFYPLESRTRGLPFVLCVRAGKDGTGAKNSVLPLAKALGWKPCSEVLILRGDYTSTFESDIAEICEAFATGLTMGIY